MRLRITELTPAGERPLYLRTGECRARRRAAAIRRAAGPVPPRAVMVRLWHFRCAYCNCPVSGRSTVDHLTPIARGGRSELANLAVACHTCNEWKGARTAEEIGHQQVRERACRLSDLFEAARGGDWEAEQTLRSMVGGDLLAYWIGVQK